MSLGVKILLLIISIGLLFSMAYAAHGDGKFVGKDSSGNNKYIDGSFPHFLKKLLIFSVIYVIGGLIAKFEIGLPFAAGIFFLSTFSGSSMNDDGREGPDFRSGRIGHIDSSGNIYKD